MNRLKEAIARMVVPHKHEGNFHGWEKIETVALVLDDRLPMKKQAIDQWVAKTGKSVDVYFCETRNSKPSYADWICLTRKEKTVAGLPKRKNRAVPVKYDLMINACGPRLFPSTLSRAIRATCKCGAAGDPIFDPDIVVERKHEATERYLEDVLHYLRLIKPAN